LSCNFVSNQNITDCSSREDVIGVINVVRMLQAAEAGIRKPQLESIVFKLLGGSRNAQEQEIENGKDDSQSTTPCGMQS